MDIVTYVLCKKIAEAAASGIERMYVEGLTLYIVPKQGETIEINFPEPENGISIINVSMNENRHLICTMSDSSIIDAGELPVYIPQKGVDYFTDEEKQEMVQEVLNEIDTEVIFADDGLPIIGKEDILYVYNSKLYRWIDNQTGYRTIGGDASIDWEDLIIYK